MIISQIRLIPPNPMKGNRLDLTNIYSFTNLILVQALLELLNTGSVDLDETRVLKLAENAKFYRVAEFIYRNRRQFIKVFECIINDTDRNNQAGGIIAHFSLSDQ